MGNSDRVNETRQTKIVSDDADGKSGVGNYECWWEVGFNSCIVLLVFGRWVYLYVKLDFVVLACAYLSRVEGSLKWDADGTGEVYAADGYQGEPLALG